MFVWAFVLAVLAAIFTRSINLPLPNTMGSWFFAYLGFIAPFVCQHFVKWSERTIVLLPRGANGPGGAGIWSRLGAACTNVGIGTAFVAVVPMAGSGRWMLFSLIVAVTCAMTLLRLIFQKDRIFWPDTDCKFTQNGVPTFQIGERIFEIPPTAVELVAEWDKHRRSRLAESADGSA